VLSGIPKPIDYNSLTEWEQEEWATVLNIRDELLDKFDETSRNLGLNVPEHKCWCGKPAKYGKDLNGDGELVWFCNKCKDKYEL
jgi:hypothetical protein